MSKARLQVDEIEGFQRISLGEFDETFPRSSPVVRVITFLIEGLAAWQPSQSVLVGHWRHQMAVAGWRRVASFPYRYSLIQPSTIDLLEVPDRSALPRAIECAWRLPRMLLLVAQRSAHDELARLSDAEWASVFNQEIPSILLELRLPMVALGFYHQRWLSMYLPDSTARSFVPELLARFPDELVEVNEEL